MCIRDSSRPCNHSDRKLTRTVGEGTPPLSTNDCGTQDNNDYISNVIRTDLSKELMEEEDLETARPETGLTEVRIQIEGKEVKTLVDTGSEISVISEHILEGLQEQTKISHLCQ